MSKDSKIPNIENLPKEGLLRLKQVLQFIPVSRSSWYAGVACGRYPKGRMLSERVKVYTVAEIRDVINGEVSR